MVLLIPDKIRTLQRKLYRKAGILTIRDRVVQIAVKLVIESIFSLY